MRGSGFAGGCAGGGEGVSPQVFVALAGGHGWTGCGGTEFCDGTIQHIHLVEKVHSYTSHQHQYTVEGGMGWTVDGEPFVEVFSFGEEDCLFEVSGSEDGGCVTFELGCFTAFLHCLFRFKCIPCTCVSITHQRWRRKGGSTLFPGRTLSVYSCGGETNHRDDATTI